MPSSISSRGELEGRLACGRDRARSQGYAHAAAVGVDPPRHLGDLGQAAALLRGGAGDLLHEHGDADAAPAGGVEAVLHGDVVVGDDGDDVDARFGRRQLGRHLEVHDVTGVVLDDVQDASAAVDVLGRLEHLVGHRRGEDLAGAGRVQHAQARRTRRAAVRGPSRRRR